MATALKLFGAALLLVSLALPMATCAHYEDAGGRRVAVADPATPPPGVHRVVTEKYAFDGFDVADGDDWLRLFTFLWPVFALLLLAWRKRGYVATAVRVAELLLLGWTFWLVDFLSTFLVDRRAAGAYVAFLGLGLYAAGTLATDLAVLRRWRAGRRADG